MAWEKKNILSKALDIEIVELQTMKVLAKGFGDNIYLYRF